MFVTMQPRQRAVEPQRNKDTETRPGRRTLCLGIFVLKQALPILGMMSSIMSARAESSLLENSPFLPPDATGSAVSTSAPLELRSILKEGGQYEFSLYDPARKQSTWVGLNEPGNPFLVKAFNPANDTITVEQRSRTYMLTLKKANISMLRPGGGLQPVATMPPMPIAPPQDLGPSTAGVTDSPSRMERLQNRQEMLKLLDLQRHAQSSNPPLQGRPTPTAQTPSQQEEQR
jgi:hypothetical protein